MRPVSTEVLENGVTQPAFFLFSQAWADDVNSLNNRLFKTFYANSTNSIGVISIDGTTHYDFSDLPLLSPLAPWLGLKGPINGKRVTTIVDDYLLTFFESTLQGKESNLFSQQTRKYSEVKMVQ